ncbi:hypothetical protein ONR75_15635 [Rhodopseudomonas sp. P2A-2r]|uniref:hypothetical protein n=1 Tax=Rhodopseudomonas sp. P2A-2r TaxID=2991972 RepID=UPI002233FCE8|nr:hypothetical protein [Rhodopseudomonas sp. P2A-2r]UZE51865.1 hypothetical protein ONR75_15635 [Rhodopseudomonas sp. P2A-2r]
MSSEVWLRIDEHHDVLASTDLLALIAPTLAATPSGWKWAILAAQNAVHGALVCAIQDTSKTNVLTKSSAKTFLKWLETCTGDYPAQRMADFMSLLEIFQELYPDVIDTDQAGRLGTLHKVFRNQFAHFVPMSWSIEIQMLPPLLVAAFDFVEVAMRQDQVSLRTNGNFKRKLSSNLETAKAAVRSRMKNTGRTEL